MKKLLALGGVLLLLAGCTGVTTTQAPSTSEPDRSSASAYPTELERYYTQQVDWSSCDGGECTTVKVPLDYANPGPDSAPTRDIAIAVKRHTVKNPTGTVFVNPGGPGASGLDMVDSMPQELSRAVNVVGFDPRGVGQSTAVDCFDDTKLGSLLDTKEADINAAVLKQVATSCEANSAGILPYVGTTSAAKDLDILRATIAGGKLNYVGFSYGTLLGSEYAREFPRNVGRLVLDGAVDASLGTARMAAEQSQAFEESFRMFVDYCHGLSACPLKGTTEESLAQIRALAAKFNAHPLPASTGRPLTGDQLIGGLVVVMYEQDAWFVGVAALNEVINQGSGTTFQKLFDVNNGRGEDGSFSSNVVEANWAINCADYPAATPAEEHEAIAAVKDGAVLGDSLVAGADMCGDWPYHPAHVLGPYSDVTGIPPVVVVGTRHDPATPYAWAEKLHKDLPGSVLLTYEGAGHTAYLTGGSCIQDPINAYLINGTVPKDGITCEASEPIAVPSGALG